MKHTESYRLHTLTETTTHRVTEHHLPTGSRTGSHTHEWPYSVVPIRPGVVEVHQPDGTSHDLHLVAGQSYDRPAGVRHDLVNRGETDVVFIEVERISAPVIASAAADPLQV